MELFIKLVFYITGQIHINQIISSDSRPHSICLRLFSTSNWALSLMFWISFTSG